jgi:dTDP-L-rhamnose 4-epimerase
MKRALVAGGAGLIGSHVAVIALCAKAGKCASWIILSRKRIAAEDPHGLTIERNSSKGDLRDRAISAALDKIDIVFTRLPTAVTCQITKYVHVNSLGTAQMLRSDSRKGLPVRKIIVASSQAVYSEAPANVPSMGWFFHRCSRWNNCAKAIGKCICPLCSAIAGVPTPENARLAAKRFTA